MAQQNSSRQRLRHSCVEFIVFISVDKPEIENEDVGGKRQKSHAKYQTEMYGRFQSVTWKLLFWLGWEQVLGSSSSRTSHEDESPNKMYGRRSYLATLIFLYVGSIRKCSKDGIHESYVRLTSQRFLITLPLYYYQGIQTVC